MLKLRNTGTDHRKFMRMITVSVDITAPLYFWKQFETYKVGIVSNGCSTMHKIHEKRFTIDDFSHEHLTQYGVAVLSGVIEALNMYRSHYVEGRTFDTPEEGMSDSERMFYFDLKKREPIKPNNKHMWWQMIQLLPSSYNQKRTITLNYEVLVNIYKSRKNHILDEWRTFCEWIKSLPFSELITGKEVSNNER